MKIEDFGNLHDAVKALYPNHRNLFEYDTAKPQRLLDAMSERLAGYYASLAAAGGYKPSFTEGEIYAALRVSVYAYGYRGFDNSVPWNSEGLLPLSAKCLYFTNLYRELTGENHLFTPIIENLRPTQEGV